MLTVLLCIGAFVTGLIAAGVAIFVYVYRKIAGF